MGGVPVGGGIPCPGYPYGAGKRPEYKKLPGRASVGKLCPLVCPVAPLVDGDMVFDMPG